MGLKIEIKKEDPKTLILYWDGEIWKNISKSLFINELKKLPQEMPWEEFKILFSVLEEKIAKNYALYLLSKRSLLSSELKSKLLEKGISSDCAKKTIATSLEKGYLNDENEIERLFARELKKGRSAKAAYFKIKQKAGNADLRKCYEQALASERETLQRWLEKNKRKIKRADPKELRKWSAKLCRQGFNVEMVLRELEANHL